MDLADIRKFLNRSDGAEIAALTGYSVAYVRQVLNPNNPRKNEDIMEKAREIAHERRARRLRELSRLSNMV